MDERCGCSALVRIQSNSKAGIDSFKLNTAGMRKGFVFVKPVGALSSVMIVSQYLNYSRRQLYCS